LTSRAAVCSAHHDLHVSVSRTAVGMGSSTFVGVLRLSKSHPAHVLHWGKAHLTSIRAVCAGHHGLQLPPIESGEASVMGSSTALLKSPEPTSTKPTSSSPEALKGKIGNLAAGVLSASHSAHVLHWGKAHLTPNRAVWAGHHGLHAGMGLMIGASLMTAVGAWKLLGSLASHPAHPLHWGKAHLTSIRAVCAGHHGLHTWSFPASWLKPTLDVDAGQGHDAAQFECMNTGICSHSP
jgi:hypothetical protein